MTDLRATSTHTRLSSRSSAESLFDSESDEPTAHVYWGSLGEKEQDERYQRLLRRETIDFADRDMSDGEEELEQAVSGVHVDAGIPSPSASSTRTPSKPNITGSPGRRLEVEVTPRSLSTSSSLARLSPHLRTTDNALSDPAVSQNARDTVISASRASADASKVVPTSTDRPSSASALSPVAWQSSQYPNDLTPGIEEEAFRLFFETPFKLPTAVDLIEIAPSPMQQLALPSVDHQHHQLGLPSETVSHESPSSSVVRSIDVIWEQGSPLPSTRLSSEERACLSSLCPGAIITDPIDASTWQTSLRNWNSVDLPCADTHAALQMPAAVLLHEDAPPVTAFDDAREAVEVPSTVPLEPLPLDISVSTDPAAEGTGDQSQANLQDVVDSTSTSEPAEADVNVPLIPADLPKEEELKPRPSSPSPSSLPLSPARNEGEQSVLPDLTLQQVTPAEPLMETIPTDDLLASAPVAEADAMDGQQVVPSASEASNSSRDCDVSARMEDDLLLEEPVDFERAKENSLRTEQETGHDDEERPALFNKEEAAGSVESPLGEDPVLGCNSEPTKSAEESSRPSEFTAFVSTADQGIDTMPADKDGMPDAPVQIPSNDDTQLVATAEQDPLATAQGVEHSADNLVSRENEPDAIEDDRPAASSVPSEASSDGADPLEISIEFGRASSPVIEAYLPDSPSEVPYLLALSPPSQTSLSFVLPQFYSADSGHSTISTSLSLPHPPSLPSTSDSNFSMSSLLHTSPPFAVPSSFIPSDSSGNVDLLHVPMPIMDNSMSLDDPAISVPAMPRTPKEGSNGRERRRTPRSVDVRSRQNGDMSVSNGTPSPSLSLAPASSRRTVVDAQPLSPGRRSTEAAVVSHPASPTLLPPPFASTLQVPSPAPSASTPEASHPSKFTVDGVASQSFDASFVLPSSLSCSDNLFDVSMTSASETIFGQSVQDEERPFPPVHPDNQLSRRTESPEVPGAAVEASMLLDGGLPDLNLGELSEDDDAESIPPHADNFGARARLGTPMASHRLAVSPRLAAVPVKSIMLPLSEPLLPEVPSLPTASTLSQTPEHANRHAGPSTPRTIAPLPAGSRKARYTKRGVVVENEKGEGKERKAPEKEERRRKQKAVDEQTAVVDASVKSRGRIKEKENSSPPARAGRVASTSNALKLSSKLASAVAATAAASRSPLRPNPLPTVAATQTHAPSPKVVPATKKSQIARPASAIPKPSTLPKPSGLPRPGKAAAVAQEAKRATFMKAAVPVGGPQRYAVGVAVGSSPGRSLLASGAGRIPSPRKAFPKSNGDLNRLASPLLTSTGPVRPIGRVLTTGGGDFRASHLHTSILSPPIRALGSPMRVMVDSSGRETAAPSKASTRSAADREPSPPIASNNASTSSSVSAASNSQDTEPASEPRRTPYRAAKADSPHGGVARPTARLPVKSQSRVPSLKKPAVSQAPPPRQPAMSETELKALTAQNTNKNQVYHSQLDKVTIYREGPRPPSPSSRIRTVAEKNKEETKASRDERAKRRGALKSDMGIDDPEMSIETTERPLKHARGPGDEDDYNTPAAKRMRLNETGQEKPSLSDSDSSQRSRHSKASTTRKAQKGKGKGVRWDRGLVVEPPNPSSPSSAKQREDELLGKGCLIPEAKAIQLDALGNVPEAGQPPKDIERQRIKVAKFVFEDDPPEPGVKKTRKI